MRFPETLSLKAGDALVKRPGKKYLPSIVKVYLPGRTRSE
jgi:hypothetical protein